MDLFDFVMDSKMNNEMKTMWWFADCTPSVREMDHDECLFAPEISAEICIEYLQ